jgi:hypothetical protein
MSTPAYAEQSVSLGAKDSAATARPVRFCMALLIAFVVLAVLPWWNRYIGVTNDAWHYFYGLQILHGRIPYRDFYLFVPPLYALKNALLITLFGNHLIVPHVLAVAEIIVMALVLLLWIKRVFPLHEATVGITTAVALYILCFQAEPLGGLHQEAVFFPVLAGWAASTALEQRRILHYLLAGVFAGCAFMTKQNSGMATVLCLGLLLPVLLRQSRGTKAAILGASWYAAGVAIPVGSLCAWLAANGGLASFIADVYVKGPSSKGGMFDALMRPFVMIEQDVRFVVYLLLAFVFLGWLFWSMRDAEREHLSIAAFSSAALVALSLGVAFSRFTNTARIHDFYLNLPKDVLLFSGEIGCLVLFIHAVIPWRKSADPQLILLTGFSTGLAYIIACSWVDYTALVMPSLAVFLAYAVSRLQGFVRMALLAVCVLVIFQYSLIRMNVPFGWGGWVEPNVQTASQRFPEPELAGFIASPESVDFVNRVTQDIVTHSSPEDTVLLEPDIPIFYLLAYRNPATFAYVHWIDVAPDFIDQADAASILRHPPAVIGYIEQSEDQVHAGRSTLPARKAGRRARSDGSHSQLAAAVSRARRVQDPERF